jgi:hypothetical protein
MAETVINGVAGGGDVKVGSQSYKTTLNQWRVVMDIPESDSTTFNDEPYEATEPGPTRAFFDLAGIMKQGALSSGPFMPPPVNAALVFQATLLPSPCSISFTGNFTRAEAIRIANANGRITGSGRSTGPIVVTWNRGP